MIAFLLACYIALLALFVWFRFIPLNRFWKVSPVIVLIGLNVDLFIPMTWGAPQGPIVVARHSVSIIPVGALEAQLKFAELRLSQMSELQTRGTGRSFDVEQRQAEVEQLRAQLEGAKWSLDRTTVLAPADGFVTNLALRPGARITAQSPVMAFIDTSETLLGAEIPQISARYVEAGQPVEVTFKTFPGRIRTGRVETVLQAIATGQGQVSGLAATPPDIQAAPFVIRIKLDDPEVARRLPAGSTGVAAIFTDRVKPSRIILRQVTILNYVNPF